MKTKALTTALGVFLACVALAFTVAFTATHAFAQASDPQVTSAPSPVVLDTAVIAPAPASAPSAPVGVSAPAAGDLLSTLGAPSWVVTALSIFATVSIAYQSLIAFAHKRAAETVDLKDDQWLASLDAKPWFRILDRVFYWGGYLGSRLGGKKL